jgi:hypothetical protein
LVADDDPLLQPARLQTLHVRWAAATLIVALVTSVVLNIHVHRKMRPDERLNRLAERLRGAGGELMARDREPFYMEIGMPADVDMLAELSRYPSLLALSLSGSEIDDELLRQLPGWLPNLNRLDLARTGVTAAGLQHLLALTNLGSLGLAGSDLTIEQINEFVAEHAKTGIGLHTLDLSDTGLNAEAIRSLDQRISSLAICRLGFTDSDLAAFGGRQFAELDISGNSITGKGLVGMSIHRLVADDVPLTDEGLRAFLGSANATVDELVLSKTHLTDQSAPLLLGLSHLQLGEGTISEAALAANVPAPQLILALRGQQFTGTCLAAIGPRVRALDLSGSGVTDQALIDL